MLLNKRGRDNERPAHLDEEWPPLATTRESPRTETKERTTNDDLVLCPEYFILSKNVIGNLNEDVRDCLKAVNANHQRNANQNYNEVSPHTSQNGHHQKIYKQ